MHISSSLLAIAGRIAASAFFSAAELSMAAAKRLGLRQLADEGGTCAAATAPDSAEAWRRSRSW